MSNKQKHSKAGNYQQDTEVSNTQSNTEEAAVTPIRQHFTIPERSFGLKSAHILEYHVFAPEGSTIEDFLSPDCWAHIARKLQPLTDIRVTEKTGKWIALLTVVSCNNNSAVTEVVWYKDIAVNASMQSTDNFEVKWINHEEKFGVLRKSDKVWVARNLPTSADAAVVLSCEVQAQRRA